MSTPFSVTARAERRSAPAGSSTLWAAVRIDPTGSSLERERAPLAVALVIDVSGSMQGPPLAHTLASCEVVAALLDARDQLAIVTFSTTPGVRCGLTTMDDAGKKLVTDSLRGVTADGNTNLHGGMEVGAGVLAVAKPGLRRVMVLMSDGKPNVGFNTASALAGFTRSLGLAVSTLGFGIHHDDAVLEAIALAGSGRYAYVPDPMLARVDVARAALAHGGIVAAQLQLEIALADGVELVEILPTAQLRHTKAAVICAIGDVFIDEGRLLAVSFKLDLNAKLARGHLADLTVSGVAADGTAHKVTVSLDVDIHAGPHVVDRDAEREIVLVHAEGARTAAREQAIRGGAPAAALLLRKAMAQIDALPGFVRNDGSPLAELREQLEDEAANYESKASAQEVQHQVKSARSYQMGTVMPAGMMPRRAAPPPGAPAFLLGAGGPLAGQRYRVLADMVIGRSTSNEIPVPSGSLSRRHARIVHTNGNYVLQDLGSTNGSHVNGVQIQTKILRDGDLVKFGEQEMLFECADHKP
jgi:Ca-activated chloride channel family protein